MLTPSSSDQPRTTSPDDGMYIWGFFVRYAFTAAAHVKNHQDQAWL